MKLTTSKPGSEVAGEASAALAAASLAFLSSGDSNYAATLLRHAEELYTFANDNRGKYTDSFPDAAEYYK